MERRLQRALFATVVFVAAASESSSAQPHPLAQKQISRGATSHVRASPQPRVMHVVYGTLTLVRSTTLMLRTRRGIFLHVDAAPAVEAGTYSAPFFVGKIVAVGGYFDAAHVLHASSVMRLTRLDPSTGPDR
ncbi:MAG: hypothetical protein IAI50_12400 [Candidatus Eremiobacteraeota bacterium]|nr:hypothetical protein [Candidatus Eremiobacteraeota bacterium]